MEERKLQKSCLSYENIAPMADLIKNRIKLKKISIGIICGSGFDGIAEFVENPEKIFYVEVPGLPVSTVPGHKGCFVVGTVNSKAVICMQGRFHPYEGYSYAECSIPIRIMFLLGVRRLFITNAAGGLNPDFKVGDLMLIKDHIFFPGLAAQSPLRGPNDDRFGPRFTSMSDVYSIKLRQLAKNFANAEKISLHEGIYGMAGGPQYETPAEIRFLRVIGVDAIGMSTCHEAITAHHCGMTILGLSLITNKCIIENDTEMKINTDDVFQVGENRKEVTTKLIISIIANLED